MTATLAPLLATLWPRAAGAARMRAARGPSREALIAAQRRAAKLPAYLAEFRLTRGRCRRARCKSRYAVTRVSVDFTNRAAVERLAVLECAACGHVWRRIRPPRLGEYQSVRLSLILPAESRRWYARGRWHVTGSDAVTVREATQADLMAAAEDWRKRNGQYEAARARARAKRAEANREATERTAALLDQLAAQDAQRAADEAAAAAREG